MARYKIITLVDITRTNPVRSETDATKLGQQANFNSLVQAIGIRSNVTWETDPIMKTGSLPRPIDGKANHWVWEFDVEREDVFLKDSDPVGHLLDDLHGVPIVDNLKNSTDFKFSAFITQGDHANIWITVI